MIERSKKVIRDEIEETSAKQRYWEERKEWLLSSVLR